MPEKVNSYVKQRAATAREMNGGTLRFRSPCPWLQQSQGCLSNVSLHIFCRGFFPECFSTSIIYKPLLLSMILHGWVRETFPALRSLNWLLLVLWPCMGPARQRCRQGCCLRPPAPLCPPPPTVHVALAWNGPNNKPMQQCHAGLLSFPYCLCKVYILDKLYLPETSAQTICILM